jgi:arsenate reductase
VVNDAPLRRRLLAEFLGSAFLAAVVIGSGIAAEQLSPGHLGLELLENALATAAGLFAIILMVGPVSGGHLNPVVSLVDAAFGGLSWLQALAYVPAQVLGCLSGAVVANLMFSRAAVSISTHGRASGPHVLSETVATVGLILVIFALARTGRGHFAPAAVGAYIGAAYFFTSSTSFANPAITVGRMFSDTFAGIAPASVPSFVAAQILGGILAVGVLRALYPGVSPRQAADVVLPHHRVAGAGADDEETTEPPVPSVLFVCTHNAGRSLAAKVLLDHYAEGRVDVRSAGSAPGHAVNPVVVAVLAERGLDASREFPTLLTDDAARAADVIVTMGCGDTCPVYPGRRYVDWDLPDPAGKPVDLVRPIVNEIDGRVRHLLEELTQGAPRPAVRR